jgi:hypothetical protein
MERFERNGRPAARVDWAARRRRLRRRRLPSGPGPGPPLPEPLWADSGGPDDSDWPGLGPVARAGVELGRRGSVTVSEVPSRSRRTCAHLPVIGSISEAISESSEHCDCPAITPSESRT